METPQTVKLIERSESIKEIASALAKFQGTVANVKKDEENPFFKSEYATLGAVVDVIKKPMSDNGLSYVQFPTEGNKLVTLLMHTSGEYFQSVVDMHPKDTTPQAQGSAITYMRRYTLMALLGLAPEDDDGNEASSPKNTNTTVKTGKLDSGDDFAKAVLAIDKYTTLAQLENALIRVQESEKFSDGQKEKLEKQISSRIDFINSKGN